MDAKKMHTVPLCPSCRHNQISRFILAGVPSEAPRCARHIVSYPEATNCRDYEREPGAD